MKKWMLLAGYLLVVLGGGLAIGYGARPDAWYSALAKPVFNPPNWVFAPVWTTLYVLIAVAGWRTALRAPGSAAASRLWWSALALNFLWSPTFFVAHELGFALIVVLALWLFILAFIRVGWRSDRVAASLFIPYALWVTFAATLNAALLNLNPHAGDIQPVAASAPAHRQEVSAGRGHEVGDRIGKRVQSV